jgi:hypothetical protein
MIYQWDDIQIKNGDKKKENAQRDPECKGLLRSLNQPSGGVVLQVSNADKFVAECLSCVLRLPNRKGCR